MIIFWKTFVIKVMLIRTELMEFLIEYNRIYIILQVENNIY